MIVLPGGMGANAILRNEDFEVAHIGVVGGEEHANVGGDAGDDEALRAEMPEEDIECGGIERGVHGFEHEIIVALRAEQSDDFLAGGFGAGFHDGAEVGLPAAEVVVDVNGRNAGGAEAFLQCAQPSSHGQGEFQGLRRFGELEGVDDIDEEQRGIALVRGGAVEVLISFFGHRDSNSVTLPGLAMG